MRDSANNQYFLADASKTMAIKFANDSNTYGNGNIVQESLVWDDRMTFNTECLMLGDCVVTECEFDFVPMANMLSTDYLDESVTVKVTPTGGTQMTLIDGYVVEDEITNPTIGIRHIVVRDKLSKVLSADATAWYNGLTFPMTFKNFRLSFQTWVTNKSGLTFGTYTLVNDNATVKHKISGTVSGADILRAITEINGVFAHVVGSELKYISMVTSGTTFTVPNYRSGKIGKADTPKITQIYLRNADGTINGKYPSTEGANPYDVSNLMCYGLTASETTTIATNLYNKVKDISFRYVDLETIGSPCREVGDRFSVTVNGQTVYSNVIGRRLKGIQNMMDALDTPRKTTASSVSNVRSIMQRQGALTVTLQETTSGLSASVSQEITDRNNAISSAINTEVANRNSAISGAVAPKLDAVGGTQSFGWDLTSTAFKLKNNGTEVFKCDANGVEVNGNGTFTGTIGANGLKTVGATQPIVGASTTEIKGGSVTNSNLSSSATLDNGALKILNKQTLAYAEYSSNGVRVVVGGIELANISSNGISAVNLVCGSGSINSNNYVTISFPKAMPSIPKVVASYTGTSMPNGAPGPIKINNVTKNGFNAVIGGSWSGDMPINWIAMC